MENRSNITVTLLTSDYKRLENKFTKPDGISSAEDSVPLTTLSYVDRNYGTLDIQSALGSHVPYDLDWVCSNGTGHWKESRRINEKGDHQIWSWSSDEDQTASLMSWEKQVTCLESPSKPSVIIVDQTSVPSSFGCVSLFVNGSHILSADEHNNHPVESVAESLSTALNVKVENVVITTERLARSIVKHDPLLKEDFEADLASGEIDFDEWCEGYTNNDLLNLIKDL